MSKKLLRSIAITAVFAGGYFATDAITEPTVVEASTMVTINGYQYSKEVVETLNLINAERKKMGCDELKINSKLSKSAEAHAKYLTTNVKGASHDETKGKAGFTGADHGERAKSAGYTLTEYDGETHNGESITYGTGLTPAKVVSLTIQGVYHRDTILNPDFDTIGIGIDGGAYVFVTDNSDFSQTRGLNTYPYNGQTDVPTTFSMNEKPNPLAGYGVTKAGYIVSGMPSQPESLSSDIYIFITDSKGNNVPVLEKDNISSVANAGNFVIPKEPLKEDETYTVTMNYLLRGTKEKATDTWSFTTAKSGTSVLTPT